MTSMLCGEKIAIMHKTPPILLLMLWILGSAINAAQQTKSGPTAKPCSACALVTKAEIEQAIGTAIGNGVPQQAAKADVCAYANPKGNKVNIFISRSQDKRDLSTLGRRGQKGPAGSEGSRVARAGREGTLGREC